MHRHLELFLVVPSVLFVMGVFVLTTLKLLKGSMLVRGLLTDPTTGELSALRVQTLISTLGGALAYALAIGHHQDPHAFPRVDEKILAVFGGSQGLLVAGRGLGHLVRTASSLTWGK